jgi:hypothetical protein
MLTLAALFTFAVAGMAVFVVFALLAGVLKLVFKVAILPLVLVVGLLKLVVLPLVALVLLVALGFWAMLGFYWFLGVLSFLALVLWTQTSRRFRNR